MLGLVLLPASIDAATTIHPAPDFSAWLEHAADGRIHGLAAGVAGKVYVLGDFTGVLTARSVNIARFNPDLSVDASFRPPLVTGGAISAAAEQPDGRVIIIGSFTKLGGISRPGMARLMPDGALDPSFVPTAALNGPAKALALQANGGILVGGSFTKSGAAVRRLVVRFRPDGSLDEGFAVEQTVGGSVNAIVLRPDGKIYVGGRFNDIHVPGRSNLLRLREDGRIDNSFESRVPDVYEIYALIRQPDGRLIYGCQYLGGGESIRRLWEDGTVDASFAVGTGFSWSVTSLLADTGGAVIASGLFSSYNGVPRARTARLLPDGSLDTTFGSAGSGVSSTALLRLADGRILAAGPDDNPYVARGLTVLDANGISVGSGESARRGGTVDQVASTLDGKWYVRGTAISAAGGLTRRYVARLQPNGAVDEGFHAITLEVFDGTHPFDFAPLADGGLLILRGSSSQPFHSQVRRFAPDGTLDTAFGSVLPQQGFASGIETQPDGKILALGAHWNVAPNGIMRLNQDGTRDASFQTGSGFDGIPTSVTVLADGKLLAVGAFTSVNGVGRNQIARLHANGALDVGFDPGTGFTAGYPEASVVDGAGRYIVWGSQLEFAGVPKPGVLRLTASGALDPTFDISAAAFYIVDGVAIADDGHVWVAGALESGERVLRELDVNGQAIPGVATNRAPGFVTALIKSPTGEIFAAGTWTTADDFLRGGLVRLEKSPPPTITASPTSQTASPGGAVTFSVTATGDELTYQWFKDGSAIAGATQATLTLSGVQTKDAGSYAVTVSNGFVSVTSPLATLTGASAVPVITTQPQALTVAEGGNASLSVTAQGNTPLIYQWRHHGIPLPGATASILSLASVEFSDDGFYDVIVTSGLNATVSAPGRIFVVPAANAAALKPDRGFQPKFEIFGGSVSTMIAAPDGSAYYVLSAQDGYGPASSTRATKLLADGAVDPDFRPPSLRGGDGVTCGAVQADGKVVIGGNFLLVNGRAQGGLIRLHANGTLDTLFPIGNSTSVSALALQADGKILASITTNGSGGVVRFHPNGTLDSSFLLNLGSGRYAASVAVQPDGKILVGGNFGFLGGSTNVWLARFEANGSRDASFVSAPQFFEAAKVFHVDAIGRILVGQGDSLLRLNPDGTVDPGFSPLVSTNVRVRSVVVRLDGRIIASGRFPQNGDAFAVRLATDGTIENRYSVSGDTSYFHLNAIVAMPNGSFLFGGDLHRLDAWEHLSVIKVDANFIRDTSYAVQLTSPAYVAAVASTMQGKIVVGGNFTHVDGVRRNRIARLHANGTLDLAFDPGAGFGAEVGALTVLPTVYDVVVDAEDRVIAAGGFGVFDGFEQMRVARLNPDGSRDRTFQTFAASFDRSDQSPARAVALQADGKILVAGGFREFGGTSAAGLIRLNADGSPDPTLNIGSGFDSILYDVVIQDNGKLVVAGQHQSINDTVRRIVSRLHADGSLDPSFQDQPGLSGAVRAILAWPDNRVVVGDSGIVRRLTSTGAPDPQFAATTTSFNAVISLLPAASGATVAGGWPVTIGSPLVERINANGSLDSSLIVRDYMPANGDFGGSQLAWADSGAILAGRSWTEFIDYAGGGLVRLVNDNAPEITAHPTIQSAIPGGSVTFAVSTTGANLQYQWFRGDTALAGASSATLVLNGVQPGDLGSYTVRVSNSSGTVRSRTANLIGAGSPPSIVIPPVGLKAAVGTSATMHVQASGGGGLTYQWQMKPAAVFGGTPAGTSPGPDGFINLSGATGPILEIPSVQRFHAGTYRVVVASGFFSTTSAAAAVGVLPTTPSPDARLLNLSTRAQALTGDDVLIPGFVVAGTGTKRLLIRAVGPTLGLPPFNLGGVLPNPTMRLLRRNAGTGAFEEIAANDNWGTNPNAAAVTQTAADLFAFGFNDDREAALLMDVAPGEYTVIAGGVNNATGLAIVELYDADSGNPAAKLINISNRGFAGVGDQVMIPGFVVSSEGPKTLLVRVVGPTLGSFGVAGTMTDPKLEVFPGGASTPILANDNWGDNPDAAYTAQIAAQVSAFPLTAGSKDAAFVVTLPPGSYTVVGSSTVANGTGVVLVEVYVVP